jgi:hypothetical protein
MNRVYSNKTADDLRTWIARNVDGNRQAAADALSISRGLVTAQLAGKPIARQQAALMDALDALRELGNYRSYRSYAIKTPPPHAS